MGQRAYVATRETIDWLHRRLQNIPIDPDTPYGKHNTTTADYVLDAMQLGINAHVRYQNTVFFPGTGLEPSRFVWCTGGTDIFDSNAIAGREFVRTRQQAGRLLEIHVQLDEWGQRPRINHLRLQPRTDGEPPRQRRRFDGPEQNSVGTGLHPVTNRAVFYTDNTRPTYHQDRAAVHRHQQETEDGREEVAFEEWLVRYGAPTATDVADTRRLTPEELRNGSSRTPANPGSRPRLVFATVPQTRTGPSQPPRDGRDEDYRERRERFDPPDGRHHKLDEPYRRDDACPGGGGGGIVRGPPPVQV